MRKGLQLFSSLLAAGVTTATAWAQEIPAVETIRPPNIILVLVDDLGWADLGCYGSEYYETPHLDALASQGMRFTNAYAACAVCSPTRAAILTGRYPARLGITDWIRPLAGKEWTETDIRAQSDYVGNPKRQFLTPRNPRWMEHDEITIAELLQEQGYISGFVGKWHLGPEDWYPEDQGFDFNAGGCDYGHPPHFFDPYPAKHQPTSIPNLPPRKEGEYLTDREADEAVSFIKRSSGQPFFLYLCHYAVHSPIQAKQDLIDYYQEKPTVEGDGQSFPAYAAMVHSVDDAMGALLKTINELDIADNTLIIFTSDNGGATHFRATDNRPLRSGKGRPYEGGIREPFIVCWPGQVSEGSTCDTPISSIDLLPTVCEITGAALPTDRPLDGSSLMPLFKERGEWDRTALYWHFPHYWAGKLVGPYSIIREGDWKLIRFYEQDRIELYNLTQDLSEKHDLSSAQPEKVYELNIQLENWLTEVGAKLPMENPEYKPPVNNEQTK